MLDLFSMFDYCLGSSNLLGNIIPWHGNLFLLVFLCSYLVYFYSVSDLEAFILWFVDELSEKMPKNSKIWGGTPHLVISLYFLLLSICVLGFLPYSYPLGAHFVVSVSLSIPFWYMTFGLNFNPNWRLAWIKNVCEGNNFVVTLMVIGSECMSVLVRWLTLAARLSINLIIGSIVTKMISGSALSLFFPFFFYYFFNPIFSLFFGLMTLGIVAIELCVMILQSSIFFGLVVCYLSEVLVKPE